VVPIVQNWRLAYKTNGRQKRQNTFDIQDSVPSVLHILKLQPRWMILD
jgi:hypothetical protein